MKLNNIFQELKSEEDDDKEYANLENDKNDKKIRNEWIQSCDHRPINKFFKNSYYDIQPNQTKRRLFILYYISSIKNNMY